jgi:tellurite resistance protein
MDLNQPGPAAASALSEASEEQLIAALEIMHFVAKADGFLSADELRQFLKFAKTIAHGKINATHLGELVSNWGKRKVGDVRARLTELKEILGDPEICRAAYDLAAKMATADGKFEAAEMKVLELVEETLGIR